MQRYMPDTGDSETNRRTRLTVALALVCISCSALFSAIDLVHKPDLGTKLTVFTLVACGSLPLLRMTGRQAVAAHYLLVLMFVGVFFVGRMRGGLVSTVAPWPAVLVLAAVLLVGRRQAWIYVALSAVLTGVHYVFDAFGIMISPEPLDHEVFVVTTIVGTVLGVGVATIFERGREHGWSRMEDERRKVETGNAAMRRVLDNVEQGFVTFDLDGVLGAERSAAADRWLGEPEPGATIDAWIGSTDPDAGMWIELGLDDLRADLLPAELVLQQLPSRLRHGDRTFDVRYHAIGHGEAPEAILMVISDMTDALAREASEEAQRELVAVFARISRDRAGFIDFVKETERTLDRLTDPSEDATAVMRMIHTIKGNCGLFGLTSIARRCHEIESGAAERGVTPDRETRRALANTWTERSAEFRPLLGDLEVSVSVERAEYEHVVSLVRRKSRYAVIDARLSRWRTVPMRPRLDHFAEQARQLALRLGKGELDVDVEDGGVRFDAEHWRPFWQAFTHVVRNAVDHGLESATTREAAGKPIRPTLRIRTEMRDDAIALTIEDDGAGIDWNKLERKAESAGLPCTTRGELIEVLFKDGVSTKDDVTDLSGRGVGMAAVRVATRQMGGSIHVESEPGEGTRFEFSIPVPHLTLDRFAA